MPFNFLKKIFGTKSYLGVDIGTTSIKLVELQKTNVLPELINYGFLESYGHLERLNNAIQTSTLKMMDQEIIGLLKLLIKNSGMKSIVSNMPSSKSAANLHQNPANSALLREGIEAFFRGAIDNCYEFLLFKLIAPTLSLRAELPQCFQQLQTLSLPTPKQ